LKDLSLNPAESETIQALKAPEPADPEAAPAEAEALEPPDWSGAWAQADRDRAIAENTADAARTDFFTDCLLEQDEDSGAVPRRCRRREALKTVDHPSARRRPESGCGPKRDQIVTIGAQIPPVEGRSRTPDQATWRTRASAASRTLTVSCSQCGSWPR
jgi:hypothetical protein